MAIDRTEIIRTRLADGTIINVQAENLGGEEYIALGLPPAFDEISTTIEGIAKSVVTTLRNVRPHKGTVEFGLQIAVESGKLTTLLVKGSGAASLKITLEWEGELSTSSQK
jgi:hypothetical protein